MKCSTLMETRLILNNNVNLTGEIFDSNAIAKFSSVPLSYAVAGSACGT